MGIFIGILEEGLIYAILALGVLITYRILRSEERRVGKEC